MQRTSASTRSFSEKKKKSNDPTGEHSVYVCLCEKEKKNIWNEFHGSARFLN